jgi:hypothetical protein
MTSTGVREKKRDRNRRLGRLAENFPEKRKMSDGQTEESPQTKIEKTRKKRNFFLTRKEIPSQAKKAQKDPGYCMHAFTPAELKSHWH